MNIYAVNWQFWFTFLAIILALISIFFTFENWKTLRLFMMLQKRARHSRQLIPTTKGGIAHVIYNPTKNVDFRELKEKIAIVASQTGMQPPKWVPTTVEDSGYKMAINAVKEKASLVITAGGDGTVRAVAAGLCSSGIPMGVLPVGTTNLLYRNLGLPLNDLDEAISIALTGRNRQIDMGWMQIVDPENENVISNNTMTNAMSDSGQDPKEFAFLIMAGMGFDGDIMNNVPQEMKKSVGWFAYVWSALKNLRKDRINLKMSIGDNDNYSSFKARTVLFANCGYLPGNIALLPDARVDDGWLEIAIIDIKSRIMGWMSIAVKVILQSISIRTHIPKIMGRLEILRTHKAHLLADEYQNIQIDGEAMGKAKEVKIRVQSEALIVRTI